MIRARLSLLFSRHGLMASRVRQEQVTASASGMGIGREPHQRLDTVLGEGGRVRGDALDAPALDHVAGPHPVGLARRLRDDERVLFARGDDATEKSSRLRRLRLPTRCSAGQPILNG